MGYLPIRERRPAVACLSVVLVLLVALCGPVGLGTVLSWVFGLVLTIVAIACSIYGAVRSKTLASLGMRTPQGRLEMAGDIAFKNGDAANAVPLYTKAIAQQVRGALARGHRQNRARHVLRKFDCPPLFPCANRRALETARVAS